MLHLDPFHPGEPWFSYPGQGLGGRTMANITSVDLAWQVGDSL